MTSPSDFSPLRSGSRFGSNDGFSWKMDIELVAWAGGGDHAEGGHHFGALDFGLTGSQNSGALSWNLAALASSGLFRI